jgi:hypothetical protein
MILIEVVLWFVAARAAAADVDFVAPALAIGFQSMRAQPTTTGS